jgi:hypothetical protein
VDGGRSGYWLIDLRDTKTYSEYHAHGAEIVGRAGIDDFGLSADRRLVVSQRALNVVRSFNLDNCDTEESRVPTD